MLPTTLTDAHGLLIRVNPIPAPGGLHPAVQRLTFADGVRVIAKQYLFYPQTAGHPYDLLDTESDVTRTLAEAGCPVAHVLATDPETGVVFLEDLAARTLDDVAQQGGPSTRARVADRAIEAFGRLQSAFVKNEDHLKERVAPGTEPESVIRNFLKAFSELPSPLPGPKLLALAESIADRPLVLGPTDYNARNILIAENESPHFIDLAKVGYDWPERRLVQYVTSLGAGTPGGRVTSLLDPLSATRYGPATESTTAIRDLDAHHVLFHTLALLRGFRVPLTSLAMCLSNDEQVSEVRRRMFDVCQTERR